MVTLLLTPQDAQKMMLAASRGPSNSCCAMERTAVASIPFPSRLRPCGPGDAAPNGRRADSDNHRQSRLRRGDDHWRQAFHRPIRVKLWLRKKQTVECACTLS